MCFRPVIGGLELFTFKSNKKKLKPTRKIKSISLEMLFQQVGLCL